MNSQLKLAYNEIYNMDCVEGMRLLDDESIDLTITSPPYDNLRKYHGFDWNFDETAKQLFRVTKEGGVIVWVVSDATVNGSETGSSFQQAIRFKEIGFRLYDTMIWAKPSPASPTESRYYNVFEYMFVFSKGRPKTINLLADRKNKTPAGTLRKKENRQNKEQRVYKNETRASKEYSRRFNIWTIANTVNKTGHPAIFPDALARDHIKSWSKEGDLILDPFSGSGTVAKMAKELNRNYIAFEISSDYCELSRNLLASINK